MTYTKLAALALAVLPLAAVTYGCAGGGLAASAPHTYELGTIGGFSELVNSGVKTLALSDVLAPAERTMRDFGVRASNLFLYYRDLDRATAFYRDTLGLELVADYQMARIFRVAEESYLILVDAAKGMHTADEPKSVALALLTDQLEQWHDYLATKGLKPGRPFAARPGSAHDGFVIKDPEGYLLEFERFNQHPENERFVPLLKANRTVRSPKNALPEGLGFKATITWLYYKDLPPMQTFYEEVLGLRQVVDQGWAKVYEGSMNGAA